MKKKFKLLLSLLILPLLLLIVTACNPTIYTVQFDLNGGMIGDKLELKDKTFRIGDRLETIETPTREGYDFDGWYYDETFETKLSTPLKIEKDLKFYAKWLVKTYTITFNSNGGTPVDSIKAEFGSSITKPKDPIKDEFTFDKWYLDEELENEFIFNTMPAKDLTLYAGWVAATYEVKFESVNIELESLRQHVERNKLATVPETPLREGYTFNGWLLDGESFDFSKPILRSITLVANWSINQYQITFNTNGGSLINPAIYDFNAVLNQPANPAKSGYTFKGWFKDNAPYDFTDKHMPAKSFTLVAKWEANTYTVKFNKNGSDATGTVENITATYDTQFTLPTNSYSRVGYTFVSWNTKANGTGTNYTPGESAKNLATSGETQLFAKWKVHKYTIIFNPGSEEEISGSMDSLILEYTQTANLTANAFKKTGHTFAGWATEINGTKVYDNNHSVQDLSTVDNAMINLYALWNIKSYKFTVIYNDGATDNLVKDYYYKEAIEEVTPKVPAGKVFDCWVISGTINVFSFDGATMPANNLTIEATFENEIYINFNSDGGTPVERIAGAAGDEVTAPTTTPEKEGHTFRFWSLDGSTKYEFTTMPSSTITLTALWDINKYDVTYDTNGGNETFTPESLDYNTELTKVPTKTGYTFIGWFDETLTNKITNVPANNITVKAKWQAITYTVKFDDNDDTVVIKVDDVLATYDVEANLPTMERESHILLGWALSPTGLIHLNPNDKILNLSSENGSIITLYAIWEIRKFTVNINYGSGKLFTAADVPWGTIINAIPGFPAVNRVGHTWVKWTMKIDDPEITTETDINANETQVTNNIILTAHYTVRKYTVSFIIDGQVVYQVELDYGTELSFDEYVAILESNYLFLKELREKLTDFYIANTSNPVVPETLGATATALVTFLSNENLTRLFNLTKKSGISSAHTLATELRTRITNNQFDETTVGKASDLNSTLVEPYEDAADKYYVYHSNNNKPSKPDHVFHYWMLGESTVYESYLPGSEYQGYAPAGEGVLTEAKIVAKWINITTIVITEDPVVINKISWEAPNTDDITLQAGDTLEITYYIYNTEPEFFLMDTTTNTSYTFLTAGNYSIPGNYKLKIIAKVVIKNNGKIVNTLQSNFAETATDFVIQMQGNDIDLNSAVEGDYFYKQGNTFYFYTGLTYDFKATDSFTLVDASGNPKTYGELVTLGNSPVGGTNNQFKTKTVVGEFYFKRESTIYLAKILPFITQFGFGEQLSTYTTNKQGTATQFLNPTEERYQIGKASSLFNYDDNGHTKSLTKYLSNAFRFDVLARTIGGNRIELTTYPDLIEYKFYRIEADNSKTLMTNSEMGAYNPANYTWQFSVTGNYEVIISVKDVYVTKAYKTIIQPITLQITLNTGANVYSHKELRAVFSRIDIKEGINLHSNITAEILDTQRYTKAAYDAGNPFLKYATNPSLRVITNKETEEGSVVNFNHECFFNDNNLDLENVLMTGYIYIRASKTDLNEQYTINGNLFSVDGSNLPYSSTNSIGNLSKIGNEYKIANQQVSMFYYLSATRDTTGMSYSTSKLTVRNLNIKGNTETSLLNSSNEAELQSSVDRMNQNSGGYVGIMATFGSHLDIYNSVISNTTIAAFMANSNGNNNINYLNTYENWANSIYAWHDGQMTIRNSYFGSSGGAAIHLTDNVSKPGSQTNQKVDIDNATIIDNYVSGEEGYFKAHAMEYTVMLLKGKLDYGLLNNPQTKAYTVIKLVEDHRGEETEKINFKFMCDAGGGNKGYNGAPTGCAKYTIEGNPIQVNIEGTPYPVDIEHKIIAQFGGTLPILTDNNGIPREDGFIFLAYDIPGMGNVVLCCGATPRQTTP